MALFLASLGNPAPYMRTRHSIAHLVLRALAAELQPPTLQHAIPAAPSRLPGHQLTPSYIKYLTDPEAPNAVFNGGQTREDVILPRTGTPLTCYQNSSYMNVCGSSVVRRWKSWMKSRNEGAHYQWSDGVANKPLSTTVSGQDVAVENLQPNLSRNCNLIILHDDLELKPGKLNVRRGDLSMSSRGNNGLKSVIATLQKKENFGMIENKMLDESKQSSGSSSFITRIGVGIGRPQSRNSTEVSNYVLGELSDQEIMTALGLTGRLTEILDDEVLRMRQELSSSSHLSSS